MAIEITVEASVNAPIEKVWEFWNEPEHIKAWAFASDDWHVPNANNDLEIGGKFSSTMAAKDGSASFDFGGTYTVVDENVQIAYTMDDGRKVSVLFSFDGHSTYISETFEAETTNPIEMQEAGWQAILDNFKNYVEAN